MTKLRKIILAGLLLAASIVCGKFLAIQTPIVTIKTSFIPNILAAMLLGPWWTVLISGLADLLGALMFPSGAFFPGYTLTALISGLIYGLLLRKTYKKSGKSFLWRLALACLLVSVVCNLGLNTLWTYVITKKAIVVLAPTRLIKEAIVLPIKIIVMQGLHMIFIKSGAYKKLFKTELETNAVEETENSAESETTENSTKTNADDGKSNETATDEKAANKTAKRKVANKTTKSKDASVTTKTNSEVGND